MGSGLILRVNSRQTLLPSEKKPLYSRSSISTPLQSGYDVIGEDSMKKIGIGLVGYGMIGRVHALAYRELGLYYPGAAHRAHLVGVCTTRPETAEQASQEAEIPFWTTQVEELIHHKDVDVIDCCVPNYLHHAVAMAAIRAGKPIIVEKPLALNAAQAGEISEAALQAGVPVGMIFNYRFIPAIMRARQLIDEGFLGEVYDFQIEYLHTGYQNPARPMGWKLRQAQSGGGALVDLGSHLIDLVRYLLGDFSQVLTTTHTYISQRPVRPGAQEMEAVDVDDAAWMQIRMGSGAQGTLMATRFATGSVDDLNLLIHGQHGALRFQLMEPNWLWIYDQRIAGEPLGGKRGWIRVETVQNYPGAAVPPARSFIGWTRPMAQNLYEFLSAVSRSEEPKPSLSDGLAVQRVLDAAYASSRENRWVQVVS
jgi:predicted dehydrogenase